MSNEKYAEIRNSDVRTWPRGRTLQEVYEMFGIDEDAIFWNSMSKKIVVTENLLDQLGHSSADSYDEKKEIVIKLLMRDTEASYEELNSFCVLDTLDFECVVMQMCTSEAVELRKQYAIRKLVVDKYLEYERHCVELDRDDHDTYTLVLFDSGIEGDLYLLHCQRKIYMTVQRRLLSRGMTIINTWENVSPAVDFESALKKKCPSLIFCRELIYKATGPEQIRSVVEDIDALLNEQ